VRHVAQPVVVDGIRFRSKYEAAVAASLKAGGVPIEYEAHAVPYTVEHLYITDFAVPLPTRRVYLEPKGYFSPADRSKLLAVKEQHPELDLRLLFQNPSARLSSSSKTTYAKWAERHGFKWAKGPAIPQAWLDEWSRER
jgi:predicted nuclease of restriction endonuclease-like RecB superfamily